jgi:hypothetical protein
VVRLSIPLRGWEARRALRAERRAADAELLSSRRPSPRLAWRIAELVSDDERAHVAGQLIDILHASDERFLPGASPLDRVAVRECRPQLLDLASRIYDTSRPVAPRGMLLVRLLLDGGPMYGNGRAPRLCRDVEAAREALEPLT